MTPQKLCIINKYQTNLHFLLQEIVNRLTNFFERFTIFTNTLRSQATVIYSNSRKQVEQSERNHLDLHTF